MSTKKQKREKKIKAEAENVSQRQKYGTSIMLCFIFLLSFVFFLWGSYLLPVTDPVESNYALTAKEMVQSGDFISPQIYHSFWYDKPIMVYWLMSLSYLIFGFTDMAARLPSALCGALTIPILTWYVYRILKNNVVAIWSGAILATSLECWLLSHAIITDAILMLFTVITLLSSYIGLTENSKKYMVIAYVAAGLACLTKGPVGIVLPGLILLIWCVWQKEKHYWSKLFPWHGLLAFFLTVLPWYISMYIIHGMPFINEFLGLHNVLRATVSEHPSDNHFYYYLIVFPLSLLPWTGLFFYSLKKIGKPENPFYQFLIVWCFTVILFYTVMATKYITYTYIAIAPAAILAALSARDVTAGKKGAALSLIIPFFLLMAVFIALSFYIPNNSSGDSWWALYLIVAYSFWALCIRWKKNESKRLTTVFTVTTSAVLIIILSGFPSYINNRSFFSMTDKIKNLPGQHYFYLEYPASYTYYSDEIAKRIHIDSSARLADFNASEKRDTRWNDKCPIPTITDTELSELPYDTPVYIFVKHQNAETFDQLPFRQDFTLVSNEEKGLIYKRKVTNSNDNR